MYEIHTCSTDILARAAGTAPQNEISDKDNYPTTLTDSTNTSDPDECTQGTSNQQGHRCSGKRKSSQPRLPIRATSRLDCGGYKVTLCSTQYGNGKESTNARDNIEMRDYHKRDNFLSQRATSVTNVIFQASEKDTQAEVMSTKNMTTRAARPQLLLAGL